MNLAGTVQINNRVLLSLVVFMTIVFVIYSWNRDNQETGVTDNISLAKKINVGELLCAAIAAAEAGGREVRDTRMKSDSQLNEKVKGKTKEGVQDVLTDGDLRSHRVMYSTLTENFPDIKVGTFYVCTSFDKNSQFFILIEGYFRRTWRFYTSWTFNFQQTVFRLGFDI